MAKKPPHLIDYNIKFIFDSFSERNQSCSDVDISVSSRLTSVTVYICTSGSPEDVVAGVLSFLIAMHLLMSDFV